MNVKAQTLHLYLSLDSFGEPPNWNFWKYLVNEDGVVVNAWGPWISVEEIVHDVQQATDNIRHLKQTYDTTTEQKIHNDEL